MCGPVRPPGRGRRDARHSASLSSLSTPLRLSVPVLRPPQYVLATSDAHRFESTDAEILFHELSLMVVPIWVAVLWLEGLYDLDRLVVGQRGVQPSRSGPVVRDSGCHSPHLCLKLPASRAPGYSLYWLFALLFVVLGRMIVRAFVSHQHRQGKLVKRTLIVGSNTEAADIIRVLSKSRLRACAPWDAWRHPSRSVCHSTSAARTFPASGLHGRPVTSLSSIRSTR